MSDVNGSAVLTAAFPLERRFNPFKPELRAAMGDRPAHIVGYASVYNKLSRNLPGGFVERVNPTAFRASQDGGWPGVVCRWNHNDDFLLGTIQGNTLGLNTDQNGLAYDVIPPSFRKDILEFMDRGDVSSSSFAFRMPPSGGDDWALSDWNQPLRTLLSVELVDVAPVTTPAYPDATASARSIEGAILSLAHKFDADPTEIRSLLDNKQGVKLFKRTDVRSASVAPPAVPDASEEEPMSLSGANAAYYEAAFRDAEEVRKDYSKDQRDKLAKSGHAMPDGSFPIEDEEDLHNAVKLAGNAKDPAAAKAHIKKRAAAMGKGDAIPDDWNGSAPEKKSDDDSGAEARADASATAKDDSKADDGEDEDNDEDGQDSSGNGTEAEGRSEESAEEDRAAAATYDDLSTCAECGEKGQYGKFCANCGKSMMGGRPKDKFCADCGSPIPADGGRGAHVCAEERSDEAPAEETHQPAGTSDNGHTVDSAAENRKKLMQLQEKRFDPYIDLDSDGE